MSRFGATGNDLSIGISEDHIPTAVSGLNCLDRLSCADRCGKKLFPMLPRVSRPQLPIYAARRGAAPIFNRIGKNNYDKFR